MNKGLNIVTSIYAAPVRNIVSFNPTLSGSVRLQVNDWKLLPHVIGTIPLVISEDIVKQGVQYTTQLTASLKEYPKLQGPLILKLHLENGDIYIVGEKDLPVRKEMGESLTQKSFKITHKSWHYPYNLIS